MAFPVNAFGDCRSPSDRSPLFTAAGEAGIPTHILCIGRTLDDAVVKRGIASLTCQCRALGRIDSAWAYWNFAYSEGPADVDTHALRKTDPFNTWINQLHQRRGFNRAPVAVANKNARIVWAEIRSGEVYHPAL